MFDYPGTRSELTAWTIAIHLVLLAAASIPVLLLFLKSRKNAQVQDLVLLGAASIVTLFILLFVAVEVWNPSRPFIVGYLVYFELITFATMIVVGIRLGRQGKGPSVGCVFAALFALGLLVALLLPAVPSAREAARRMQCSNNLKQLMLGIQTQADANDSRLPPPRFTSESGPLVSWRVQLLPFIERQRLFDQYDHSAKWDAPINLPMAKNVTAHSIYGCPSNLWTHDNAGNLYTAYSMALGSWAVDSNGETKSLKKTSETERGSLLMVEACGQNIVWTEPRDILFDDESLGVNLRGKAMGTSPAILSSHHFGGANAASVDGSVHFISGNIDPEILRQLLLGKHTPIEK